MAKNSRTDQYLSLTPSSLNDYIYWLDLEDIDDRLSRLDPRIHSYFFENYGQPPTTFQEMIDNKLMLVCLLACLNQEDYDMAMNTLQIN